MIFVGDIALAGNKEVHFVDFPSSFSTDAIIGNLEGPIVEDSEHYKAAVYNQKSRIDELRKKLNISGFVLANNHIFDLGELKVRETAKWLAEEKIKATGFGFNHQDLSAHMELTQNGQNISILNFGWKTIGCQKASSARGGVPMLEKHTVLKAFREVKSLHPQHKTVVFFHWGYEMEKHPLPFDRELAKNLVDLGADLIIGCHAHLLQGAEIYRGVPIIYGIGNWLFSRNVFWDGKLNHPQICNQQLAVDWDISSNQCKLHLFDFHSSLQKETVKFLTSLKVEELNEYLGIVQYSDYDRTQYKKWFKKNRAKKKGLPIFTYQESYWTRELKNKWVEIRHILVLTAKRIVGLT